MEEKFGRIVYNEKIYNLDTMWADELKALYEKILADNEKLETEFDNLINEEEE